MLSDANHGVVTEDSWEVYLKNVLLIQMETLMWVCTHTPAPQPYDLWNFIAVAIL